MTSSVDSMGLDRLWEALVSKNHSLLGVENSERSFIFKLRTIFRYKILCFYRNSNILKAKLNIFY